jgi:predicted mannosyl-3-phosphoglycerate phosphatase (HAD superfamily)
MISGKMEARIAQLEQQLKGLTIGVKTKDLSLAASIKEWSGQSQAKPVTEFLMQIEQCAHVSNWDHDDIVNTLKAKLTGEAWQFVNGRDELTDENVRYEVSKAALVDRFSEKLPATYHYNCSTKPRKGKKNRPFSFWRDAGH